MKAKYDANTMIYVIYRVEAFGQVNDVFSIANEPFKRASLFFLWNEAL
jgi:wobble nucleotide-excising tRNase